MRKFALLFSSLFLLSASPALAAKQPSAPVNTSPPSFKGKLLVGSTLSAKPGRWSGYPKPEFTYQWQVCAGDGVSCSDILAANSSTYTLTLAQLGASVRVRVTAANTSGQGSASSPARGAVTSKNAKPPAFTSNPSLKGRAKEGKIISVRFKATGKPAPSIAYQWYYFSLNIYGQNVYSPIDGATQASYTASSADVGKQLAVKVSATNPFGNAELFSNPSSLVTSK